MENQLDKSEASRLTELETVVTQHQEGFTAVVNALREIREKRLYRAAYASFDAYLQERFGFSRSYASRLLAAGEIVEAAAPLLIDVAHGQQTLEAVPERAIREVIDMPKEAAGKAIVEAVRTASAAGRKVTQADVKKAKQDVTGEPPSRELFNDEIQVPDVVTEVSEPVPPSKKAKSLLGKMTELREGFFSTNWSISGLADKATQGKRSLLPSDWRHLAEQGAATLWFIHELTQSCVRAHNAGNPVQRLTARFTDGRFVIEPEAPPPVVVEAPLESPVVEPATPPPAAPAPIVATPPAVDPRTLIREYLATEKEGQNAFAKRAGVNAGSLSTFLKNGKGLGPEKQAAAVRAIGATPQ